MWHSCLEFVRAKTWDIVYNNSTTALNCFAVFMPTGVLSKVTCFTYGQDRTELLPQFTPYFSSSNTPSDWSACGYVDFWQSRTITPCDPAPLAQITLPTPPSEVSETLAIAMMVSITVVALIDASCKLLESYMMRASRKQARITRQVQPAPRAPNPPVVLPIRQAPIPLPVMPIQQALNPPILPPLQQTSVP